LTPAIPYKDPFFLPFEEVIDASRLPGTFTFVENGEPHPLCLMASKQLQHFLKTQKEWGHNFGLSDEKEGVVIGKMFGVLIVQNQQNEIGYLAAFSGKLAGGNHHSGFVPPVFDTLIENGFLSNGMTELARMSDEIRNVEELNIPGNKEQITRLKTARRNHSASLQDKIFDHYYFLNRTGKEKSLREIFKKTSAKNPPVGAGECAGPKLLQYAFQHQMKPLAIAEFWWGLSPKSDSWKHGHFYPCCREKCEPILAHMLAGIT
jgi:tRNA pseudouridine32 synthase/23S rRNA pseudouridine746 synthase